MLTDYDYSFSQNGLVAYKGGKLVGSQVKWLPSLEVVILCSR